MAKQDADFTPVPAQGTLLPTNAPVHNRFMMSKFARGAVLLDRDSKLSLYKDPEFLYAAVSEYFQWAADNPLYEPRMAANGAIRNVPKQRVLNIYALISFLGISRSLWEEELRNNEETKLVVMWADNIIRTDKFEGATSGIYNPMLISRDLGLSEKTELVDSRTSENPSVTKEMTDKEAAESYARTLNEE